MRRISLHRPLLFVAVALLIAAGAYGIYHLTIGRPPLAGDAMHDFGIVALDADGRVELEHTFRLFNRSRATIALGEVRSSCGCTTPHISATTIEPGEPLDVKANMRLSKTGLTTATISIPMIGRGVRTLHLRAIGKPQQHLRSPRAGILLNPGEDETIIFFAELWDGRDAQTLSPPAIAGHPSSLQVGPLTAWAKQRDAVPARGEPETWMGRFTLVCDEAVLPEDAAVTVTFDDHSLTIPVRIAQRRLAPPSDWREDREAGDDVHERPDFNPLESPFAPGRSDSP